MDIVLNTLGRYYHPLQNRCIKMPDRFSKVSDHIYRGGQPSDDDLRLMSDVYGIKTIVSLDGNIGGAIAPVVQDLGMEHIVIPIGGQSSAPLIGYLKNNIASILSNNQPVYVHCRHGSDRTGMAIAFHRMQNEGWEPEKAIDEAKTFGFGDKLDPQTEELYREAITGTEDANEVDSEAYSIFDQSGESTAPGFNPQQSFAPFMSDEYKTEGLVNTTVDSLPMLGDPQAFISGTSTSVADEQATRRKNLKKVLLETMTETVPQVGGHDGISPMGGVGPVEGIR